VPEFGPLEILLFLFVVAVVVVVVRALAGRR
jgi:hypothetical protein